MIILGYILLGFSLGACAATLWCGRARVIDEPQSCAIRLVQTGSGYRVVSLTIGALTYPLSIEDARDVGDALSRAAQDGAS
jgi:hypothetical protein